MSIDNIYKFDTVEPARGLCKVSLDLSDFGRLSAQEEDIWHAKGADYTIGNADRLYNFNQLAKDLGLTPRQVWYIYFAKHVNAVLAWVKTGKVESEGIEGRLIDIANYAKLGRLIAKQEEKE